MIAAIDEITLRSVLVGLCLEYGEKEGKSLNVSNGFSDLGPAPSGFNNKAYLSRLNPSKPRKSKQMGEGESESVGDTSTLHKLF